MARRTRRTTFQCSGLPKKLNISGCKALVQAIMNRAIMDNAFQHTDVFDKDVFAIYTSFIFDRPITEKEYKRRFVKGKKNEM